MHNKKHEISIAWEMSTYGATLEYLKKNISQVYESEHLEGFENGKTIDGTLNQDVQNLTFEDSSIDLITSSQVFEHVPDDVKGFSECFRVLKPGGALIFSIPLYDEIEVTTQLALNENGKIKHLTQPEYHGSRKEGPNSVLCYWRHSYHDIVARVSSAKFETQIIEVNLPMTPCKSTHVIYAYKNSQ